MADAIPVARRLTRVVTPGVDCPDGEAAGEFTGVVLDGEDDDAVPPVLGLRTMPRVQGRIVPDRKCK